jgi:uncharacterized protein (DUF2267 family)
MKNNNEYTNWEKENHQLRAGKRSSYQIHDGEYMHQSSDEEYIRYAPQNNFFHLGSGYSPNQKTHSLNFEKYASEGNRFVNEVAARLKCDRNTAGRVTKAVLQAIRDRLPVDDAIEFAQGLPMALKGIFIDQYDISKAPVRIRNINDFIHFVRLKNRFSAVADFHSPYDVIKAVQAVFYVLEHRMDPGQIQQIKMMLPQEIVHVIEQDK